MYPVPQDPHIGVDFSRVDATQKHSLGMRLKANNGTLWEYIKAGGTITAKQALTDDYAEGAHNLAPTSAVAEPVKAMAMHAITDNYYSWVVVEGVVDDAKVLSTVTAGMKLGSSATAGTLQGLDASSTVAQAEARAAIAAAAGAGVEALEDADTLTAKVVLT